MDKVSNRGRGNDLDEVITSVDPYISDLYAIEEGKRLWSKVWQIACREEEIPEVGDYYTYEILDQSLIIVRSERDTISAFYNACPHRGRRLTVECGRTDRFRCKYHGWQYGLDGRNLFILNPEDWGGAR